MALDGASLELGEDGEDEHAGLHVRLTAAHTMAGGQRGAAHAMAGGQREQNHGSWWGKFLLREENPAGRRR